MDGTEFSISGIKAAIGLFSDAIGLVKKTKELLPASQDVDAIERSLLEAEKAAKIAEAQLAHALGYQLCKCTFPPQVMLSVGYVESTENFACPACNKSSIAPKKRPLPSRSGPVA